jgi:hypothetical protein
MFIYEISETSERTYPFIPSWSFVVFFVSVRFLFLFDLLHFLSKDAAITVLVSASHGLTSETQE